MTGPTWVQSRTAHGAHIGTAASKRAVQAAALRPASGTGPGERRQPSVRAVPQPKQVGKGLKASRSRHHAAAAASTSRGAEHREGLDDQRLRQRAGDRDRGVPGIRRDRPSSPVTAAMAVASRTGDWSRTTTPFARSATKESRQGGDPAVPGGRRSVVGGVHGEHSPRGPDAPSALLPCRRDTHGGYHRDMSGYQSPPRPT